MFTDELTAERAPAGVGGGCSFVVGQGVGGAEASVGKASTAAECARLVQARQPHANGATFLNVGGYDCFAEFGMLGTDGSTEWQTCLFEETYELASQLEVSQFGCSSSAGNGVSERDQQVGVADSIDSCALMVMSMRPDANGASFLYEESLCFAEWGMTGSDRDEQWTSCAFPRHSSCASILAENPASASGPHMILTARQPLLVYCDMTDHGWTLVRKTAVGPGARRVSMDRLAGPDGALNTTSSSSLPMGPLSELCAGQRKLVPGPTEVVLTVQMYGAGGAAGSARDGWTFGADGGTGGYVAGRITLPLPATGEPLQLLVIPGEGGTPYQDSYWGWGGGAPVRTGQGDSSRYCGGGGGASGLWLLSGTRQRTDPTPQSRQHAYAAQFTPDSTLMMAGGGGGGGVSRAGRGNRGGDGGGD
eukprot:COSAG02_NODE_10818_length_1852_cov_1.485454_1_plen_419_part_10